jgi:peptidylprolyl isomerase
MSPLLARNFACGAAKGNRPGRGFNSGHAVYVYKGTGGSDPLKFTPIQTGDFMATATTGTTVSIHYTGTLSDGTTFDSSHGREPLSFEMGKGQIIPGLEQALDGMGVGETKTVTIPPEQAYGPHMPEGVQDVPREMIPEHIPLDLGTQLQVQTPEGQQTQVTVTNVTDETVTLDGNHPLAGKDLTFAVEVVNVA